MSNRIHVSKLPETTTEANLRAAFAPFGAIEKLFLGTSRDTGLPIYAFISYASPEEMAAAIAGMNDAAFEGGQLVVSVAREAKPDVPVRRFVPPAPFGQRRGPGGPARTAMRR